MAYVQIIDFSNGTDFYIYRVLCSSVVYGGSKSLDAKPNENIDGPVEAQTNAYDNPILTLNGVNLTRSNGTLTIDDVQRLYKHKYNGANFVLLKVEYGEPSTLSSSLDSTEYSTSSNSYELKDTKSHNDEVVKLIVERLKKTT